MNSASGTACAQADAKSIRSCASAPTPWQRTTSCRAGPPLAGPQRRTLRSSMPPVTTRFAPSPTGYLHLGHAHAALFAWRRAREAGGRFLLRLEDIDPGRCRPEYADAILEDLAWLGLDWDGRVRLQSEHLAEYRAALDRLAAMRLL